MEQSDFSEFNLQLSNGASLSGIKHIPSRNDAHASTEDLAKPLLVMLHGGGCNAHYFDLDQAHSISPFSMTNDIPVVSVNRPCYGDSTSIFPLPSETSFHEETGRWLHQYILPALWNAFGKTNSCTSIVLVGHSLASPGIIVAASLYARAEQPLYPLASLVLSGWGLNHKAASQRQRLGWTAQEMRDNRALLMLSDPELKAGDQSLVKRYLIKQSTTPPPEEAAEVVNGGWTEYWRSYSDQVDVPIMYGIGEHDWLWEASPEGLNTFASCFPRCPRFDRSLILGAPHAIDWSYYSSGWILRYIGFALETATWHKVQRSR